MFCSNVVNNLITNKFGHRLMSQKNNGKISFSTEVKGINDF